MNAWQISSREGTSRRAPDLTPEPARRLNVLVIDDNYEFAVSLHYLLELNGHTADCALDGPSGLRLALSGAYDAVVCDIGLPGMCGYEVAKRLRSEPATSTIRMVAVTAYGSQEARRQCYAVGFDAHLVKPASVADILSHLGITTTESPG